jgi:hypothetical protein
MRGRQKHPETRNQGPSRTERRNAGQEGSKPRKDNGRDGDFNARILLLTVVVKQPMLNGPLDITA